MLQPSLTTTARALRRWLTGTFAGRALVVGVVIKVVSWLLRLVPGATNVADVVDTVGGVVLVVGAFALTVRVYREIKKVLLWRVSRKLTVSYIFIGFVPVLLSIVLFGTAGGMLFTNVSQYFARNGTNAVVDQAAFMAESTAFGLEGSATLDELRERLARRLAAARQSYPFVSYAVVPAHRICAKGRVTRDASLVREVITAGSWSHVDPPATIPASVTCEGFEGLVAYSESALPVASRATESDDQIAHLAARAVAWPEEPEPEYAVVVDLPFSAALLDRLKKQTGIDIGNVTPTQREGCVSPLLQGRPVEPRRVSLPDAATRNPFRWPIEWVLFIELRDWTTGGMCQAAVHINMTIADLYQRVAVEVNIAIGNRTYPVDLFLATIAFLGSLLLVIQLAAFTMGLTLARSITGSIHELFIGTEQVRRGDFTHKITIRSRDQLGALAQSFNSMTSSIEDLLEQKAEKERMEQELRIARAIQMSLLPSGGLGMPGLSVTAHCEPAREVGGDYYDYLPIDDHRVGLLIADVAGKGTSAALYMAELKGLMLSLSQLHTSPRRLLIDANRIISRHLDSRSFITITYAVVDRDARTLTYARAGHCPLIYVPGPYAESRRAQILVPDGLVLGLQIDNGERFEKLLVEATVPLGTGDLFLFYTDGLPDAMDRDGNCFGDARLASLAQEHADLPFEELRERILREIEMFSGDSVQQDDMTILILKVEDLGMRSDVASLEDLAETVGATAGRV